MKLADCREAYQYNSSQASANVRQLAFAALAAIWLFKNTGDGNTVALPLLLWWVGGLSIGAIFFDFVQYVWNTATWAWFNQTQELKGTVDEKTEFLAPRWINWPGTGFFVAKLSCTSIAYILLLIFLVSKIQSL